MLRVVSGDLAGNHSARQVGGVLNDIALLCFLAITVVAVRGGRRTRLSPVSHVPRAAARGRNTRERNPAMTYVIAEPCVDVLDRACVEECPVDCIYEGERALYIHPDECVDCGACEPVCPVEAIFYEDDLPQQWTMFTTDNATFFNDILPGRDSPLGSPGGAAKLGAVGIDTPLVAGLPVPAEAE